MSPTDVFLGDRFATLATGNVVDVVYILFWHIMTFLDISIKASRFVTTNDIIEHMLLSNSVMKCLINYCIY